MRFPIMSWLRDFCGRKGEMNDTDVIQRATPVIIPTEFEGEYDIAWSCPTCLVFLTGNVKEPAWQCASCKQLFEHKMKV